MIELIEIGVKNILCMQPFGCLPNHITGKGQIKELKRIYEDKFTQNEGILEDKERIEEDNVNIQENIDHNKKILEEEGKEAEQKIFGLFSVIFTIIGFAAFIVGSILTLCLGFFYGNSLSSEEISCSLFAPTSQKILDK